MKNTKSFHRKHPNPMQELHDSAMRMHMDLGSRYVPKQVVVSSGVFYDFWKDVTRYLIETRKFRENPNKYLEKGFIGKSYQLLLPSGAAEVVIQSEKYPGMVITPMQAIEEQESKGGDK